MIFRSNPINTIEYSIWNPSPASLSMENEFFLLSCLPNFHKWQWEKFVTRLKFEQKFSNSCRDYPGSPRNRIIQAFNYRNESYKVIESCLKAIRGEAFEFPYVSRKRKGYKLLRNREGDVTVPTQDAHSSSEVSMD